MYVQAHRLLLLCVNDLLEVTQFDKLTQAQLGLLHTLRQQQQQLLVEQQQLLCTSNKKLTPSGPCFMSVPRSHAQNTPPGFKQHRQTARTRCQGRASAHALLRVRWCCRTRKNYCT
jgi:hypothetical protein